MDQLVESIWDSDTTTMNRLLRSGANVNDFRGDYAPLQWACRFGNVDAVRALLQHGADPNVLDKDHAQNAVHFAADTSVEIIELLGSAGADVNRGDDTGMTPVMIAAKCDRLDIIKVLVKHGANLRIYDKYMQGPLHWSAVGGPHSELNAYLVEAGADPHAITIYGKTYMELLEIMKSRRVDADGSELKD